MLGSVEHMRTGVHDHPSTSLNHVYLLLTSLLAGIRLRRLVSMPASCPHHLHSTYMCTRSSRSAHSPLSRLLSDERPARVLAASSPTVAGAGRGGVGAGPVTTVRQLPGGDRGRRRCRAHRAVASATPARGTVYTP